MAGLGPAIHVLFLDGQRQTWMPRHEAGHDDRVRRRPSMKREDLTEKLLDIKREKGWSWKHI